MLGMAHLCCHISRALRFKPVILPIFNLSNKIVLCPTLYGTFRNYRSTALSGDTVRIGCASGFWGDTAVSAPQLIQHGELDFLVFDYLSEITMSLLTVARRKDKDLGYAPDFVQAAVGPHIKDIEKKGLKVVSNAGGINPHACAAALRGVMDKAGVKLNVAVVTGDDLMDKCSEIQASEVRAMDSGQSFPKSVHSMNAYLGAGAIARSLSLGADIVVTGRCVDSALTLGPLMYKFGWKADDYDLLAAGSLAGHLVECGAQATGGIFTDWQKVTGWSRIGFPIVECSKQGSFVLTKPKGTGGMVTTATVAEQLVYEIGDPRSYILPDVICDFADVQLTEIPDNVGEAVLVSGAKGRSPTNLYKVSATFADGYRATAVSPVGGPMAVEKAEKTADAILKRTRRIFKQLGYQDYIDVNVQVIGSGKTFNTGQDQAIKSNVREAVLWLAAKHQDKKALEFFAREIAPAGTGMAPGLTGIVGGRPRVSPVLKLFSFLYPKDQLKVEIFMNGSLAEEYQPPVGKETVRTSSEVPAGLTETGCHSYRLEELAYTRSGDKGNNANIGVIARDPAYLPYIRKVLTPENIDAYFRTWFDDSTGDVSTRVERYELPGIGALNFVLKNCLGGGGVASLRIDPQGKALGQLLLDFRIENVPKLL